MVLLCRFLDSAVEISVKIHGQRLGQDAGFFEKHAVHIRAVQTPNEIKEVSGFRAYLFARVTRPSQFSNRSSAVISVKSKTMEVAARNLSTGSWWGRFTM
jgi:hypothetical protein